MNNDVINGLFEWAGSMTIALNVAKLIGDRVLKGVNWQSTAFFTLWGLWNLHYYPSLGQWFSFSGAVAIVSANGLWLFMVWVLRETKPYRDS